MKKIILSMLTLSTIAFYSCEDKEADIEKVVTEAENVEVVKISGTYNVADASVITWNASHYKDAEFAHNLMFSVFKFFSSLFNDLIFFSISIICKYISSIFFQKSLVTGQGEFPCSRIVIISIEIAHTARSGVPPGADPPLPCAPAAR